MYLIVINMSWLLLQFTGSFVVVDESGKEKALESGCKVACIVSQVLFYDQVRALQKSPEWCVCVSISLPSFCVFLVLILILGF